VYSLRAATRPEIGSRWAMVYSGLDAYEREIYLLKSEEEEGSRLGQASPVRDMAIWHEGRLLTLPATVASADTVDVYAGGYVLADRWVSAGGGGESDDPSFTSPENLWLLDDCGQVKAGFSIGRQFNHLAADLNNNIWAGYRDEAGFWRPPENGFSVGERNETVLLPGVCQWTLDGRLLWVMARDSGIPDGLFYCYSLNAGAGGVFAAVDWEESVVRLDGKESVEFYPTAVVAPHGLATDGERVLLLGRFERPIARGVLPGGFDVVTLYQIRGSKMELVEESRVVMPDGSPLPGAPRGVCSRGRSILMHFKDPGMAFILRM
jgi:hypothetical protein